MVEAIWRYPLKSAQGESVVCVFVGPDGPDGDRLWACIAVDGTVVSAKNPRRWGRLLHVVATMPTTLAGAAALIHVPGAPPLAAGTAHADRALSDWLGEEVRLTDVVPAGARLSRSWPAEAGMIPDWVDSARPGQDEVTAMGAAQPGGRFVDAAAVHIVTTAELDGLAEEGVDADVRRFRPTLVLSLDEGLAPGQVVQVGADLTLRTWLPTPRCAIPGAAQAGVPRAPEVLRAVGRYRVELPGLGRAAVFGTYAQVVTPGTVTVGDEVLVTR